jgi:DNA-binding response OmpR family regulator
MMASAKVLLVEDEPMVAEVVERYLKRDGHTVRVEHEGDRALQAFGEFRPDLVLLDLMLPGLGGLEICRAIRARSEAAVIMLTARGEESDRLVGLGLGADDYITKPFSPREVAARVQAVLRRSQRSLLERDELRFEGLTIDRVSRRVEGPAGPVSLTAREFDLLEHLASHAGRVFTRDQLLASLWDHDFEGDESTVTVHMRRLRAKVEADPARPRHLKTVWGLGYRFEP